MNLFRTAAIGLAGTACVLAAASQAQAFSFSESVNGSAGRRLNTAGDTTGLGPVTPSSQISGGLGSGADLFKIEIAALSNFMATTVNTPKTGVNDTQLFLFDSSGRGLLFNDDTGPSILRSTIKTVLDAGIYYIGVSKFDFDPRTANPGGTEIFPDISTGQFGPLDPNAVLGGWTGNSLQSGSQQYLLDLNAEVIPTPALLPGLLGMGAAAMRKRRRQNAEA